MALTRDGSLLSPGGTSLGTEALDGKRASEALRMVIADRDNGLKQPLERPARGSGGSR
jgi:hypothetical protein